MRSRPTGKWIVCVLLLLCGLAAHGAQQSQDQLGMERLVALCKLWNAVKLFHPYLAYRNDIDWDKALVDAIPRVEDAKSAEEYAAAVQSMLDVLKDPATRVLLKAPASSNSAKDGAGGRPPDPTFKQLPDGLLLVSVTHYEDMLDFNGVQERAAALKKEIATARAVIFDVRSKRSLTDQERGELAFGFDFDQISNVLSSSVLAPPGERRRVHVGFVPQRGGTSGGYESAFYTALSAAIKPSEGAKDLPVVFVVNQNSELPIVAAALQSAEKGAIVAEGETGDASAVTTQLFPLSNGVTAQIRLGELLYQDGSSGLRADVTVPVSSLEGEQNPALQAALSLARNFKTSSTARKVIAASAPLAPEKPYAEMSNPIHPYRLLAAFRIWGVINYFYPYRDLMGEDWDGVLREFIPRVEKAGSALEYNLAVAEMVTHIHDGHGFVQSAELDDYFGASPAPVRVRMIEGLPVITGLFNEQAAKAAGVEVGDVILKVDGEDAKDRLERFAKYLSASTPQARMYYAANRLLRGPENSQATVMVRDPNDQVKELKIPRQKAFREGATERKGDVLRMLPGNIGYVDLDRLATPMVEGMFEKFKDTKAIIFDDRTYPLGTAWAIAPRLTAKDSVKAAMFQRRVAMYSDAPLGDEVDQSVVHTFFQELPHPVPWTYKGKTVMLIDERTQSQAEHTGLFLEAANGTKFVGSPTAGANGDVTNFCVPGGIWIYFTGQGVRHADGRQLQRVGLVPDVEVRPTLKGIRAGKDEVLDKAIEYLQHEIQ